ncbi:hypothetical protein [Litorivita sp. NS0012-18]|uniref:hypothetical protein n=1 Tax=Litorivita sp. NS0012-18 TaxID=3127655 RepID=UPI00333FA004
MLRGSIIWFLTELFLLIVGFLIAPFWIQEHLLIVFVLSAALLMVFLCYENWPKVLQFSRDWQWADLEAGGRYYRDLLSGYGRDRDIRIFDTMSSPIGIRPQPAPWPMAFVLLSKWP